ncbi:MAG: hypothetical protein JWO04_258 [Gammaproteobacteria bacterium]|nr:hypothetical protein [Gammaproteobacteria bacterium]
MLPYLHVMPRIARDIEECLDFVARQPRGKPNDRKLVIVYAYLRPTVRFARGVVSIRAVRHSRVKDVFSGVREPTRLA